MNFKLELVPIPVSDVERAKTFYADGLGFHVDHDMTVGEGTRIIQLTPTGSACSILIGTGVLTTEPGCVQALHLVVEDIHAARDELVKRGVKVKEVEVMGQPGYPSVYYAAFSDPDGNGWTLQQIGT
ncbi:VOC family protein [Streptomyces sp. H39-S7]|uniref:VOC family protein n=1 Tax=Streptomyces sp. H39-S7 TaxID=3004357 RepID=UPI0022AE70D5|nr:VOC family protein [Streptomyces sp. H39-S7]MCZ4126016.1 VOC family protein [Streptomyces sp. H39-S7]